jgi:hypothetical protein
MRLWLSKQIYETLPFFYLIAGVISLAASLYLDYWYWPTVCLIIGFACLILGLVVYLKRRDFRNNRKPLDRDIDY